MLGILFSVRKIELQAAEYDRDPMQDGCMTQTDGANINEDYPELLRMGSNSFTTVTSVKNGIDVSKFQGNIDWTAVKASGVEFAFIRVGYRGLDYGTLNDDPYYKRNIEQANAAGVKVGVYIFSQATTPAEAEEEAEYIVSRIRNYKITLPVVIDYEFGNGHTGRLANANLSKQAGTDVCRAFCARVESYGYTGMVYANKDMLTNYIYGTQIADQYLIWLAQYNNQVTYEGNYNFWQYSSKGTVSGINGVVDMDFWYVKDNVDDFSLNGLQYNDSVGWAYYKNGVIDTSYTGVAQNSYGKWYIKNGYIDWTYTGMVLSGGAWYYVANGQCQTDYTGMACNENGWWYFTNGQLDWNYTGYGVNQYGYWYYRNGRIASDYTGMLYEWDVWRYLENGHINFDYTGMACNEYGWWYFTNGDLDWHYTGMACNEYGWWYYQDGRLDWNYTGYGVNQYGYWYYRNGRIASDYTGMLYEWDVWRYLENGHINFDYTGMACNEYGWWYFTNGDLDWHYTGMACNEYGWWYYQDGRLDWHYTGKGYNQYGEWNYVDGRLAS